MIKRVITFFDKLEDVVRIALSHYPIPYALIGGVGIVLFWKGVWETAELLPILFGPGSILLGMFIMLITGLLVSFFIGDKIILSGLTHEKKMVEKTESEVRAERHTMNDIMAKLEALEEHTKKLQEILDPKK